MIHTNDRIIKHKTGLLNLAEELGDASKTCKMLSVSRDTFYRYKEAVSSGGVDALPERVPNHKNRVDTAIKAAVVTYALQESAHGQVQDSNELRKRGVFVSPSRVRSIWLRHYLATSNCDEKRLRPRWLRRG
ncbi:hypothetical protein GL2_08490 [Microbulbifer sp. GL-2]|nr:hypothetical protein GL2_08490 [Microbulbifer sp. GL-2]